MPTDKVRRLQQYIGITREELRASVDAKQDEGIKYGIEFSIATAKGEMTNSEALSFLETIERVLKPIDGDQVAQLEFHIQFTPPVQLALTEAVKNKMQKVLDLENASAKLVSLSTPKA